MSTISDCVSAVMSVTVTPIAFGFLLLAMSQTIGKMD
jgi:hypothetical protein